MSGTRFLFCCYSCADPHVGQLTVVYTTTRKTFETHGYIDDGYEDDDWELLLEIGDRHGFGELMESVHETPYTPDELVERLAGEPDIAWSTKLLQFILEHDPFGERPYLLPAAAGEMQS